MNDRFVHRGGFWVLAQSLVLLAVVTGGYYWCGQWRSLAVASIGYGLLGVAAILGIAGTAALGKNLTPFPKPSTDARLVTTGVYRLMRHPLYTAVFCGSIGWGLVRESWFALLAALVLAPLFQAKARREEQWLRQAFPEYRQYEQQVRRFLPWIY